MNSRFAIVFIAINPLLMITASGKIVSIDLFFLPRMKTHPTLTQAQRIMSIQKLSRTLYQIIPIYMNWLTRLTRATWRLSTSTRESPYLSDVSWFAFLPKIISTSYLPHFISSPPTSPTNAFSSYNPVNKTKSSLPEGIDEEHIVLHFLDDYTAHVTGGQSDHKFMELEPFIAMLSKEDDLKLKLVELGKQLEKAECDFTCLGDNLTLFMNESMERLTAMHTEL